MNINNVEKLYQRVKLKNIELFRELVMSNYKVNGNVIIEKEFLVQDPNGYLLRFSEVIS